MLRQLLDIITSLKLTIVCLAAAMILIFAGTIAQVHLGIYEAQRRYFPKLCRIWWPAESNGFQIPIFPGGHLIGAILLVNLIAAHLKRFRWSMSKLGIHLYPTPASSSCWPVACSPTCSRSRATCA